MITTDHLDTFEDQFGSIPKVVSRLIRPTFIAEPGKTLVWSDWSAIEARVLPWLTGAPGEPRLEVFRACDADDTLPGLYEIAAGQVYGKKPEDVDKTERQVGKVIELSMEYGGGVGALSSMAAGYGVSLEESLKARIVKQWRSNNPWATDFWAACMDAFMKAWENPNSLFHAERVSFIYRPTYLYGTVFMIMPDGRSLTYPALRRDKVKVEDKFGDVTEEVKIRYQAGYERKSLWHGILVENATQAVAAALLREAIVRCRNQLLHTVGHTHDEIMLECDEKVAAPVNRELARVMETVPEWAEGLPLVAETTVNWFYSKAV